MYVALWLQCEWDSETTKNAACTCIHTTTVSLLARFVFRGVSPGRFMIAATHAVWNVKKVWCFAVPASGYPASVEALVVTTRMSD